MTEAELGAYRLRVPAARSAELFEIMADGTENQVSVAVCWSLLADSVGRDWNGRLLAKGQPLGVMPDIGDEVLLHLQFGRELDVLFVVAASYQEGREMVPLWEEATPEWRLTLWRKLRDFRADIGTLPYSAQDLQEWLRQSAPDGSEDVERQGRLTATRRAAKDRIAAEHKSNPNWKTPKVQWRR